MSENNKITTKDIHRIIWSCRDFELTNLWQRSVFLTAFIVLCYTGYGAVLMKIFDGNKFELNIVAFLISLVGIIFSILWIKMGKGSKAWYEKYEDAICKFETNEKYIDEDVNEIGGFELGKIGNLNDSILSLNAGAYSVSRINIAIGQISLSIWVFIGIIHLVLAACRDIEYKFADVPSYIILISGTMCIIVVFFIFGRPKAYESKTIASYKKIKMKKNCVKLTRWETILIFISALVLVVISIIELTHGVFSSRYPVIFSILVGLFTAVLTTIFILYVQRVHRNRELADYFSKIEGKYIRKNIGQDNTGEGNSENMKKQNVELSITLTYEGGYTFSILAEYWSNESAKVSATVVFDRNNRLIATGYYYYIEGKSFLNPAHFGSYVLYTKFENNDSRIFIRYHHLYPRDMQYNPDNNRGWEEWEKQS